MVFPLGDWKWLVPGISEHPNSLYKGDLILPAPRVFIIPDGGTDVLPEL